MNYTKFFNSNPSVSGNNAMSNIEALAQMNIWLAGQEIISVTAGEAQEGYTPLIFTKENGDTYTVNVPTIKGDKGETGASGVNNVTAGDISEDNGYTVTPVTFNFESGNSKTVSVKAKDGEKGDKGDTGDTGDTGLPYLILYTSISTSYDTPTNSSITGGRFNRQPIVGDYFIALWNNLSGDHYIIICKVDSINQEHNIVNYTVYGSVKYGEKGDKGDTGEPGLEALSITSVYKATSTPTPNAGFTLTLDDFNRTPTTNERAVMFVVTDDSTELPEAYITSVVVNSVSENTVNCMYESVQYIVVNASSTNEFNYMGEWVSNNEYHKNDCVYYNPDTTKVSVYYICTEDVSNSTTPPVNDTTHWAVISTNASKYSSTVAQVFINNINIKTFTSFPIGSNNYIHFVTLTANNTEIVVNTFCITNSSGAPSIDDVINFLKEVAPDDFHCFIANGIKKVIGVGAVAIINGMCYATRDSIKFRQVYISD